MQALFPHQARLPDAANSPRCASIPAPVMVAKPVLMQRRMRVAMLAPASQPRGPEAHLRHASTSMPYSSSIRVHNDTAHAHFKRIMKVWCVQMTPARRS